MSLNLSINKFLVAFLVLVFLFLFFNSCFGYIVAFNRGNTYTKYYSCNSNFSDAEKNAFSHANISWNSVPSAPFSVYRSSSDNSATQTTYNGSNEALKRNNGNTWIAYNTWYIINSIIVEADIEVNTFYSWSTTGEYSKYDLQNVVTHELGHFLFSGDITAQNQVQPAYQSTWLDITMYKFTPVGETKKRTLEQDDKDGFVTAY